MKVYIIFKQKRNRNNPHALKNPVWGGGRFYYEENDNRVHAVYSSKEKAGEEYSALMALDNGNIPLPSPLEEYRFWYPVEFDVL